MLKDIDAGSNPVAGTTIGANNMNQWEKEKKDLNNIRLKFRSGNEIPVPEARITRAEWESVERLLNEANELLSLCVDKYGIQGRVN